MTVKERVTTATSSAENVPLVLRRLKNYCDVTDAEIAEATGIPRSTVRSKMGGAPCTVKDLAAFAAYFDVPMAVFVMSPDEALRWVLDHPSDLRILRKRCFQMCPAA
jgi:hypothetical protein